MRNNKSGNNGHRRFMSFVSYAFSSILFDVVAYTLSAKVSGIVSAQYNILFYFPTLGYDIFRKYALNQSYLNYVSINTTAMLVILPVVTFVAGIVLEKAISLKVRKSEHFSDRFSDQSESSHFQEM